MKETSKFVGLPPRALGSGILSGVSLVLFYVHGQVHWLPTRLSRGDSDLLRLAVELAGPPRDAIDVLHKATAILAFVWGLWSLRAEPRLVGRIAAALSFVTLAIAFFVVV